MQFFKSFATFKFDAIVFRTLEFQNSRIWTVKCMFSFSTNILNFRLRFNTSHFLQKLHETNVFDTIQYIAQINLKRTVRKLQLFSLKHFWQKFHESNDFTKKFTRQLISRNIFTVRENFCFPYCETLSGS